MNVNFDEDGEDGRRRDRHDIIVEILKTALNGKVKTHIMFKARLSYAQLNEYLPRLVEKGFLENQTIRKKSFHKKIFKTTPKGIKLLENFENMTNLWAPKDNSCEQAS